MKKQEHRLHSFWKDNQWFNRKADEDAIQVGVVMDDDI